MEVAMTDLDCVKNFYDIVNVGSIHFKGKAKGSLNKKINGDGDVLIKNAYKFSKIIFTIQCCKRKTFAIINHYEFILPKRRLREKFNFLNFK